MPAPIFIRSDPDQQGNVVERVIGRRRSTNTWIPKTSFGARLSVLRNHSERLVSAFRALHMKAYPDTPVPTDEELRKSYSCIATYRGLHQELVEHLGSHKGFLVKQVMGNPDQEGEEKPKDSSAGADQAKATAPPQPVAVTATTAPSNGHGMKMR